MVLCLRTFHAETVQSAVSSIIVLYVLTVRYYADKQGSKARIVHLIALFPGAGHVEPEEGPGSAEQTVERISGVRKGRG